VDELQEKKNRTKSPVRAKVEAAFRSLKRIFGFDTMRVSTRCGFRHDAGFDPMRYRNIAKNHTRQSISSIG
jgi:hypothetical protein